MQKLREPAAGICDIFNTVIFLNAKITSRKAFRKIVVGHWPHTCSYTCDISHSFLPSFLNYKIILFI
jgi:hypothetical protein